MPMPPLTDWRNGDDIRSRDHHQESITALKYLFGLPDAGVARLRGVDGMKEKGADVLIGEVTDQGPSAQADFDDERIWVQLIYPHGVVNYDDSPLFGDEQNLEEELDDIVPAINLADPLGDHLLPVGTRVLVVPRWSADDPAVLIYLAVPMIEMISISPITAIRWNAAADAGKGALEYQTTEIRVPYVGESSAWTQFGTYHDCP